MASLECVRSYAWSKGHSEPDLSSVVYHAESGYFGFSILDLPKLSKKYMVLPVFKMNLNRCVISFII